MLFDRNFMPVSYAIRDFMANGIDVEMLTIELHAPDVNKQCYIQALNHVDAGTLSFDDMSECTCGVCQGPIEKEHADCFKSPKSADAIMKVCPENKNENCQCICF